jgi:hypothetical protein
LRSCAKGCNSTPPPPPLAALLPTAYYPRAVLLNGLLGPAVATVATPSPTAGKRITLLTRVTLANGTLVWNATGTVATDADPSADLDNGVPFQRPR